jgi:hypothetical protein
LSKNVVAQYPDQTTSAGTEENQIPEGITISTESAGLV